MKLSTFLSATAIFLFVGTIQGLPAAYDDELSLRDVLMTLKRDGPGVRVLGRDGVLCRLNSARTEVVDYVQLSARHVEEFTTWKYPVEQRDAWVGVDGRAVTNEAHLWAVPDHIIPRDPSTMVSKPKYKKILERQDPVNCRNFPCDEDGECQAEHPPCQECEPFQECVGGPTGCLVQYLCDNTLPPATGA